MFKRHMSFLYVGCRKFHTNQFIKNFRPIFCLWLGEALCWFSTKQLLELQVSASKKSRVFFFWPAFYLDLLAA